MAKKEIKELLGLAMIGEGVLGLVYPKQYTLFWKINFEPFKALKQTAAENPEAVRLFYAAEIALGFRLAANQLKKTKSKKYYRREKVQFLKRIEGEKNES